MPAPQSVTPDVTVSTVAAVTNQLAQWASNWNGTVPSGKTTSSERVIGINASSSSFWDLRNLTFPQKVWIRSVGTFTDWGCSVKLTGHIDFTGSTNIGFTLCHIIGAEQIFLETKPPVVQWKNSTGCGFYRCFSQGREASSDDYGGGFSNNQTGILATGRNFSPGTVNDAFVEHCHLGWTENGGGIAEHTWNDFVISSNVWYAIAHDCFKPLATFNRLDFNRNWDSRGRYAGPNTNHHEDFIQHRGGSINDSDFWGNFACPDTDLWLKGTTPNTGTSYQPFFFEQEGVQNNIRFKHNVTMADQGYLKFEINASNILAEYNSGYQIPSGNTIGLTDDAGAMTYQNNVTFGPNTVGNATNLSIDSVSNSSPDYTALDAEYPVRGPREGDSIQYFKPKPTSQLHWNHSNPKGPYLRLKEIFQDGGIYVPGNVGWPVAAPWEDMYNFDSGLSTTYTGNYDADGNNTGGAVTNPISLTTGAAPSVTPTTSAPTLQTTKTTVTNASVFVVTVL